jgi:hypothetical protein
MKGFRSHHPPSLDFSWRNVRKPSMNETAGSGRRSCRGRYGDLRAADELADGSRHP